MKVAAVIPAYNEEERIGEVVEETEEYVDRVIVVDDGSTDLTTEVSEDAGAEVIGHGENRGYLTALKTGFEAVEEDIVVTLDGDGENDPADIPQLLKPIEEDEADLVLGRREKIPRISERFLTFLAGIHDSGTGFRAIRSELAKALELPGVCPCGTFALEANGLGVRIEEVPVRTRETGKERKVAWKHFIQFWFVLKALLIP